MKKVITFVIAVAVGALGVAARNGGAAPPASAVARCDGGGPARSDMHTLAVGAGFAGADGTAISDEPGRDRGGHPAGRRAGRRSSRLVASGRRHDVRSRPEGWRPGRLGHRPWRPTLRHARRGAPAVVVGAGRPRLGRAVRAAAGSGRRADPHEDRRADTRGGDVLARLRVPPHHRRWRCGAADRGGSRRRVPRATSGATTSAHLGGFDRRTSAVVPTGGRSFARRSSHPTSRSSSCG